jgi:hypothetical protein
MMMVVERCQPPTNVENEEVETRTKVTMTGDAGVNDRVNALQT